MTEEDRIKKIQEQAKESAKELLEEIPEEIKEELRKEKVLGNPRNLVKPSHDDE